jgi:8-oxo-dGTP pyrophosphatase MutT (NUDIX family)
MVPVSVKGVLFVDGKVVLMLNERNEWELPGGRMDAGETPTQALMREFEEELSIRVEPTGIIDSYVFEVIPSKFVSIVTYGCHLSGEFVPQLSAEHVEYALHAPEDLRNLPLPAGYRKSIEAWWEQCNVTDRLHSGRSSDA